MELDSGKLNILIDGQFGSTGKGLLASYVSLTNHIDIAITNASANAGHTFYYNNKKYVLKQLPVAGIIHKRCQIYLCAGAIINPKILLQEMEEHNISEDRVAIHPRCAIITDKDIQWEKNKNSSVTKIASTQSGVGRALSRKIQRSAKLAMDIPELRPMLNDLDIHNLLDHNCTALMEVPQGFDLSLSSGYAYPYCTSREITISAAMADAQVHPKYLGKTMVCLRTYPIRVGNIVQGDVELGHSGPFYHDSQEVTWDDLGVKEERTTVTGRIRRIATFSKEQYDRMINHLQPDYVFMNFGNYMSMKKLALLLEDLPEVTHVGFGPYVEDVKLNHIFEDTHVETKIGNAL